MLNIISNKKKYCVFDVGTDKVACLLFKVENNKPKIIGGPIRKVTAKRKIDFR